MPEAPLLELRAIDKSFGPIAALRDVDLTLNAGEVLGLVGDNGAGKSTLMKVVSGAVIPDKGEYILEGTNVRIASPQDARRLQVEMVYQDLSLCDTVDVAKNIFLGREPTRAMLGMRFLDHARLHQEAAEILKRLHIRIASTHATVKNLSGGQRQAIAIGRAVSFHPKILVLDEPTAALAVKEVNEVLDLIRSLSEQGVGVILVTHRLQDVLEVTDRIMVMYEGRKVAERATKDTSLQQMIQDIVHA